MAKPKVGTNNEPDVPEVIPTVPEVPETPETPEVPEIKPEPEIHTKAKQPVAEVVEPAAEKMVVVRALKTHKCQIGKYKIDITEKNDYKVPDSVCTVLQNAGIVMKR